MQHGDLADDRGDKGGKENAGVVLFNRPCPWRRALGCV